MMINRIWRRAGAFSLIELLCVMAVIGILAALLLPALSQARARAKRVECVNHLRQTGIAFQNFAQDHNGQFPMSVPVNAGGSLEFARNAYGIAGEFYFSFRHFQVLSNELVTPKLVVCPADTRPPAASFAVLGNQALSYFVGISAVPASPDSILAGDRNLTNDWVKPATLLHFGPNDSLRWTFELHQFKGNLLFADGRVEERNTPGLMGSGNQGVVIADLALPTVQTGATTASSALRSGGESLPSPEATLKSEGVISPISPNQPQSGPVDLDSGPHPDNPTRPGWRTGFSAGQSQPDSPLPQAHLQPGTSSNRFITNATAGGSTTEEPGFSLFPPLFGHQGLLNSSGGHWLLFVLTILGLVSAAILLKRRLAKSQTLRRVYHEMFRIS